MRLCSRIAVFVLLLVNPSLAAADAFSDFRIPDHSWRSLDLLLSAGGSRDDGSSSTTQVDYRNLSGAGRANLRWTRDADALRVSMGGALDIAGNSYRRTTSEIHLESFPARPLYRRDSRGLQTNHTTEQYAGLDGDWTWYPDGGPWGVGASASLFVMAAQGEDRTTSERR